MTPTRISDYCIRMGAWKICKVFVMGVEWYECWFGSESLFRERFRTAAEAKAFVA